VAPTATVAVALTTKYAEAMRTATLLAAAVACAVTSAAAQDSGRAAAHSTTPLPAQELRGLLAAAEAVGEVLAIDNDVVQVSHVVLHYPAAGRGNTEPRPVVLYIRVTPGPGVLNTQLLAPPPGAAPAWRPGVVPRAVHIRLLKPPPPPRDLEEPGTDLPADADQAAEWNSGRLMLAVYPPQRFGLGTGRFPSVTTFLSDGVIDVASRGLRRRIGVQAGDALWFEAGTRLTVLSDQPIGTAIVQLSAHR
jgi:hypothetical protein